ncbi:hypothetical protein J437_LFUL012405 [Ladona fulva]|uniref:Uncharacterized protein n=1 Tax=Ladona fulva TaxID=123851 RepID=A0A8K0P895_LADFU|nr:hypothetical protein J437_LFUL012405 [Ladona fulva]
MEHEQEIKDKGIRPVILPVSGYREEMEDRPRVSTLLNSLANYSNTIPAPADPDAVSSGKAPAPAGGARMGTLIEGRTSDTDEQQLGRPQASENLVHVTDENLVHVEALRENRKLQVIAVVRNQLSKHKSLRSHSTINDVLTYRRVIGRYQRFSVRKTSYSLWNATEAQHPASERMKNFSNKLDE